MSKKAIPQISPALAAIERLRSEGGHLHSITNTVAQNFTANVLLACGASVSMTANPDEIAAFVARADALHINLGTLDPERETAIATAMAEATRLGLPSLLDPVMVHVSPLRLKFAQTLVDDATIIKTNASEAQVLGLEQAAICFVETGAIDKIHYKGEITTIENGTPRLATTIATGCALGALIAILSSKTAQPDIASLAGLLWFSVAGEIAAESANGPGSFPPALLDALASVSPEEIEERANCA